MRASLYTVCISFGNTSKYVICFPIFLITCIVSGVININTLDSAIKPNNIMKHWAIAQWSRNRCVSGLDRYSKTLNRSVTKLVNSWILLQIMESYFKYFVSHNGMAIYYCHFLGVWLHWLASSVGTEAERENLMNKWFCKTKVATKMDWSLKCCFNVVGLKGMPNICFELY